MRRTTTLVAAAAVLLVCAAPVRASGLDTVALRAPVFGASTLSSVEKGNVWVYQDVMSDPRVSGVRSLTVHRYQRSDQSGGFWGTAQITNGFGTWTGAWSGLAGRGAVDRYYSADLEGAGLYDGLVYHLDGWFEGPASDLFPGSRFAVFGWIEAADGSSVPVLPSTLPKRMTPVVGDATFITDDPDWLFTLVMSDDRVSGDLIGYPWPLFDVRPDKSVEFTNPFVLTSGPGTWRCTDGVGIRARGFSEHYTYCEATGTGAYEGLVFRSIWHFFEPFIPGQSFANAGLIVRT